MSDTQNNMQPQRPTAFIAGTAMLIAVLIGTLSFGIARWHIDTPAGDDPARALEARQQQQAAPEGQPHSPETEKMVAELSALRDSVDANPHDAELLLHYANRMYDAGLYKPASLTYERYLQDFDSTNADARVDYAFTLFQQGEADRALAESKRALGFRENHPVALYNIGIIYLNLRDQENAREWFERCLAVAADQRVGQNAKKIIEMIESGSLNM